MQPICVRNLFSQIFFSAVPLAALRRGKRNKYLLPHARTSVWCPGHCTDLIQRCVPVQRTIVWRGEAVGWLIRNAFVRIVATKVLPSNAAYLRRKNSFQKFLMPANKNALLRYKVLDDCLKRRGRYWSLEDLMEKVGAALCEDGGPASVSKRTIQEDIKNLRLNYNAPIDTEPNRGYYYSDILYLKYAAYPRRLACAPSELVSPEAASGLRII